MYYPNQSLIFNLITFYWTPDKDQTCVTMTYSTYNHYLSSNDYSIMMNVYNGNNMSISSTELDTNVVLKDLSLYI